MRMDVWIEGRETPVGVLTRAEDKTLSFAYAAGAANGGQISLALPVRSEPYGDADCRGYFANLLFEGPQLDRVLSSFKVDRDDYGALLFHLGADCPGAISITPEGTGPGKMPGRFPNDYEFLDRKRLEEIVLSLHLHRRMPDGERDPSPVAGIQGKIAVVADGDNFYIPREGSRAPTTHILKVSPQADSQITKHELALLGIAQEAGIETATTLPLTFDIDGRQINALLSQRFDREQLLEDGAAVIRRVHAEDFCQALGLAAELKYERKSSNPRHRFSAAAVAQIARQVTVPGSMIQGFFEHTIFNLLVGNTDNHAKNASLLYRGQGIWLAPLYDVVPVFMDTAVTHQFSFDHGEAQFAEDFDQDALAVLMTDLGFAKSSLKRGLKVVAATVRAIAELAPKIADKSLADGLHAQAEVVLAALDLQLDIPKRDYFPRIERDGKALHSGGWGGMS